MSSFLIPCQNCGKEYPQNWSWVVCDKCGFRVCSLCLTSHSEHIRREVISVVDVPSALCVTSKKS